MRNFSQQIFEERYGRPAVAEWHLQWHDDVLKLATPDPKTRKSEYPDILEMQGEGKGLICCPEDQICMRTCQNDKILCQGLTFYFVLTSSVGSRDGGRNPRC